MKKLIGVLLGSLFLVFPLCANADIIAQVTLTEQAFGPSQVATFPGLGSVNALLYYELSLNNGPYLQGFCVEAQYSPPGGTAYTLLSIDQSLQTTFNLNAQNYEAAAYVAQKWASGQITDRAAAQLAIWEITLDGIGNLDLSGGSFSTGASIYTTDANAILAALPLTFSGSNTWALAVNPPTYGGPVSNQPYQNYIVPVPEPGILILLGIAMSAIGAASWRIRKL
jgi:hypothetical protein